MQDDRQVKGQISAYILFCKERYASGDFKGLKVTEGARLAGREWKALSNEEKKVSPSHKFNIGSPLICVPQPYQDAAQQDLLRYTQESKTVYNKDVSKPAKAAAAA